MASDLWKVSVNGGTAYTLRELGIEQAVLDIPMMDIGTLSFIVRVASPATTHAFTEGAELILTYDDVQKFIGRVREPAFSVSNGECVWAITACDSWWELEHTVYRQPIAVPNDDFTGFIGYLSSRVTLNQDAWGREIPQGQQIANAIYYTAGQNPGKISLGAVPTIANAWGKEETREITAAEAVRRAISLAPSQYAIRTYGAGIMAMAFAARADLNLVTLDLADANIITDISGLKRLQVPPGVVFDFFTTVEDDDGTQYSRPTRQYAGTPGGAGTIYASFNLGPCDSVPAGAAAAYYAALIDAQWTGSFELLQLEYTGLVSAGDRLRIDGGQTAWETMDAVVNRVVHDLDRVITRVELGPPPGLGAADFLEQLNRLRNRPAATGFCERQHNGTEGVEEGRDDEDEETEVPGDTGEGDVPGVDGGATGRAPDVDEGDELPNPDAGRPIVFSTVDLAACISGVSKTVRVVGVVVGSGGGGGPPPLP